LKCGKTGEIANDASGHVLDCLDDVIYVVDFETNEILFANKAALRLNAKAVGMTCWSLFHPEAEGPCADCQALRIVDGRPETATREVPYPTQGEWRLIREQAITWGDGYARLVTATDVTERKRGQHIITALHGLSHALWTAEDLPAYCQKAHRIFKTAIGADNFFVGLWDKTRDRLEFPYFADVKEHRPFFIENFSTEGSKSLSARVILSGKPLFLRKSEKLEKMGRGELEPVGPLSEIWLGAPLMIDGEAIGLIGIQHYDDPFFFNERDLDLLSSAAQLIAVTLRRHQDAQALRASKERHKLMAEAAFEALVISEEGICLDVNAAALHMFGYSREEMLSRSVLDFIAQPWRDLTWEHVVRELETPYEAMGLRKDGSVFPCEIQGKLFAYHGKRARVASVRDITERKTAQDALRQSEERFRSIVKNSPLGLHLYELRKDGSLILIETNPAAAEITRWSSAGLIGQPIEEHLTFLKASPMIERLRAVALTGTPLNESGFHYKGRRSEGHFDVWAFRASQNRLAIMFQDASKRFEAEQALIEAKEAAERSIRSRSEFLANMSHELRTPLNGVFGMLQILKKDAATPRQTSCIDAALSTGKGLLAIIDDVLDFSKMDAGELSIANEPFDPRACLTLTADNFRIPAADKGVALIVDIGSGVPDQALGDEARLRQILFNLIGNALKFTDSGSVKVCADLLPERKPDEALILFCVSDSGIGIPDVWVKDVFTPFTQVDGAFSRRYKGAGLGLGIVKKLVAAMGGSLSIESEEGKGTSLYFALPFARTTRPAPRDKTQPPARDCPDKGLDILLAEDEVINQMAMRLALENLGHRAVCAANGREVLKKLGSASFDLVLMDIQMPEMDGLEATRAIRASADPAIRNIPIVALTAHAMKGDKETFLAAGMNAYASKPLDFERLEEIIRSIRSSETAPA